MTRFAVCFVSVFGELAFGGLLAISVPPFFKIELGFYRSSAAVYLASAMLTAIGFGFLAYGGNHPDSPSAMTLWIGTAIWTLFCLAVSLYLLTLYTDNAYLRARSYTVGLGLGLIGVLVGSLALKPAAFGVMAGLGYGISAILSSLVLGLASTGMLFGHWYLIDPNLPVDYLRTIVKLLGIALIANLAGLILMVAAFALFGASDARLAVRLLFHSNLALLAIRMLFGPVASLVLTWMTWQTLKIPQTMAATGLLYITVMSVLVGAFLGHFVLFRTALPL